MPVCFHKSIVIFDNILGYRGMKFALVDALKEKVELVVVEGDLGEADAGTEAKSKEIDFPRSVLKRLVKEKMKEFLREESEDPDKEKRIQDAQISKEALMAFNEAAKLFIYYVTSTANDICRESKRQNISAEDVFKALGEIDFEEFVEDLSRFEVD